MLEKELFLKKNSFLKEPGQEDMEQNDLFNQKVWQEVNQVLKNLLNIFFQ